MTAFGGGPLFSLSKRPNMSLIKFNLLKLSINTKIQLYYNKNL